jgi:hypothetical protein
MNVGIDVVNTKPTHKIWNKKTWSIDWTYQTMVDWNMWHVVHKVNCGIWIVGYWFSCCMQSWTWSWHGHEIMNCMPPSPNCPSTPHAFANKPNFVIEKIKTTLIRIPNFNLTNWVCTKVKKIIHWNCWV